MVVEKGTVFSVRIAAQLEKQIDAGAARLGLTSLDWIRTALALAVNAYVFDPADDPGTERSRVIPLRITERLKTFVDRAASKSDAQTQTWTRAALARAANEGPLRARKGDGHAAKKRKRPE